MDNITIAISEIVVGDRCRNSMGNINHLMQSIEARGLLHPVAVDKEMNLLAGGRRLEACSRLGWDEIPCRIVETVDDAAEALRVERDENSCRKELTREEAVRLGKKLEALEHTLAKSRKREGNVRGGKSSPKQVDGNLPSTSTPRKRGETREIIGKAVGMSGTTYQRAKAVVNAAEENPDNDAVQSARTEMNDTGNVNAAFTTVKAELMKGDVDKPVGKGVQRAHEAISCLKKIPKNDQLRERGFQIVVDWIRHNK